MDAAALVQLAKQVGRLEEQNRVLVARAEKAEQALAAVAVSGAGQGQGVEAEQIVRLEQENQVLLARAEAAEREKEGGGAAAADEVTLDVCVKRLQPVLSGGTADFPAVRRLLATEGGVPGRKHGHVRGILGQLVVPEVGKSSVLEAAAAIGAVQPLGMAMAATHDIASFAYRCHVRCYAIKAATGGTLHQKAVEKMSQAAEQFPAEFEPLLLALGMPQRDGRAVLWPDNGFPHLWRFLFMWWLYERQHGSHGHLRPGKSTMVRGAMFGGGGRSSLWCVVQCLAGAHGMTVGREHVRGVCMWCGGHVPWGR